MPRECMGESVEVSCSVISICFKGESCHESGVREIDTDKIGYQTVDKLLFQTDV